LHSQASFATKDGVDQLNRRQDEQERRAIVEWLTLVDYTAQQMDFIGRRQEGTGQWLLDSSETQQWLSGHKQTLFCPGIPGAGKTMSTAIIVDYLEKKFENDPKVGIAYLYCNFRRQQEQRPSDLLTSLLKQLTQRQIPLPEAVKYLYERHKFKGTRPSLDEIVRVLYSTVTSYSRLFILIDALDECQVSDGSQGKLLTEIFNLQAKAGVNLFATSRFIPEVLSEFKGKSIKLEIRASNGDVERYLDGHMSMLPSCVLRNPGLQGKIKTEIIKAVDGM
jgi:Cdc6-like AAA superfamily ATPase